MDEYVVLRPEIWISKVKIRAGSREEALELAVKGSGVPEEIEYSHTMKPEVDIFTGKFFSNSSPGSGWYIEKMEKDNE